MKRARWRPGTEEVTVTELKAHCSELVEQVATGRKELVITRRGVPVARLLPEQSHRRSPRGTWKGLVSVEQDIVEVDWSDEFEVLRR